MATTEPCAGPGACLVAAFERDTRTFACADAATPIESACWRALQKAHPGTPSPRSPARPSAASMKSG